MQPDFNYNYHDVTGLSFEEELDVARCLSWEEKVERDTATMMTSLYEPEVRETESIPNPRHAARYKTPNWPTGWPRGDQVVDLTVDDEPEISTVKPSYLANDTPVYIPGIYSMDYVMSGSCNFNYVPVYLAPMMVAENLNPNLFIK